jgi:hypothetical protein
MKAADRAPGLEALRWPLPAERVKGPSGRIYDGRALWGLRPHQQPRHLAIRFLEWPYSERAILFVIVMNCVTLAIESPLDPGGTVKARMLAACEALYLVVFTAELW